MSRTVVYSRQLLRFRLLGDLRFGFGWPGGEELGHGGFGEVAAVEHLPLVVEFGQDRGGEPVQAAGLEKTWTTSARRLTSRFSRSSGLVDQIFFQCADGKSAKAVISVAASIEHAATLGIDLEIAGPQGPGDSHRSRNAGRSSELTAGSC